MSKYTVAIDEGTTGCTQQLLDRRGRVVRQVYREITQIYPKPGWVEHNPNQIFKTVVALLRELTRGINPRDIAAIGITNQRETTVLWDRRTGKPVANAIVWQCRRTAEACEKYKSQGLEPTVRAKTGLVIDAYFSATKVRWLLDNASARGDLAFGTIDTWLLWNLTGVHATDVTNASRTMLYNIHTRAWDDDLLRIFRIPRSLLPEVHPSVHRFGLLKREILGAEIPVFGIAGDQQAALYGQCCFEPGAVKNTYGTGCFVVLNTGQKAIRSRHGLITTLACDRNGQPCYALEGSVFIAGAAIQYLRDSLRIISKAAETEPLARSIGSNNGVYFVPAFVGLGAPYWDMGARGAIVGLTRGAGRAEIARAALESIAYQTRDVIDAMKSDSGLDIRALKVDGGATANAFLLQFQADVLGCRIVKPKNIATTGLGAAFLAGVGAGVWSPRELPSLVAIDRRYTPKMPKAERERLYSGWQRAVRQVRVS